MEGLGTIEHSGHEAAALEIAAAPTAEARPATPPAFELPDGSMVEAIKHPTADHLIGEVKAGELIDQRQEREKNLLNAVDYFHQVSLKNTEKRYAVNLGSDPFGRGLSGFFTQAKAYFAGEYADLSKAKEVAQKSVEAKEKDQVFDEAKEIQKQWSLISQESARRVQKVLVKTGVTGGIGATITAALGGAVGGPAFIGALIGAAALRGGVEVWRSINPKERNARTGIMQARIEGYKGAIDLQKQMERFAKLRDEATSETEKAEINEQIDGLYTSLIYMAQEHTHQVTYEQRGKQVTGTLDEAIGEKMKLQQKREKLADLAAAVGAVGGGIIGGQIAEAQLLGHKAQAVESGAQASSGHEGWSLENYDNEDPSHWVRHITGDQIQQADPGFAQQLEQSGGYVFDKVGEPTGEAIKNMTTATLKDGRVVHALGGIPKEALSHFAEAVRPEVAQQAATQAGSWLKEALPMAAAQALFFIGELIPKPQAKKNSTLEPVAPSAASAEPNVQQFSPDLAKGQEVDFAGKRWQVGDVQPDADPLYRLDSPSDWQTGQPYSEWHRQSELNQLRNSNETDQIATTKTEEALSSLVAPPIISFAEENSHENNTPTNEAEAVSPDLSNVLPTAPEKPVSQTGRFTAAASPEVRAVESLSRVLAQHTPEERSSAGIDLDYLALENQKEPSPVINYTQPDGSKYRVTIASFGDHETARLTHIPASPDGKIETIMGGPRLKALLQEIAGKLSSPVAPESPHSVESPSEPLKAPIEPEKEEQVGRFNSEEYASHEGFVLRNDLTAMEQGFAKNLRPFIDKNNAVRYRSVDPKSQSITLLDKDGNEHTWPLNRVEPLIEKLKN